MTAISEARDAHNRRMLELSFRQAWGLSMSSRDRWLLEHGTPEERDAAVRAKMRRLFYVGAAILGLSAAIRLLPAQPTKPIPEPVIVSAGRIDSVQLHETAFSTATTVVTTMGTYQVRGGVSAAKGDEALLKEEAGSPGMAAIKSLCVESRIKRSCYNLL